MTDLTAAKLIFIDEIKNEIHKKRDDGNWGPKSEAVAACLVNLETEIDKKLKRLKEGESVYLILPHLEDETSYDNPTIKKI